MKKQIYSICMALMVSCLACNKVYAQEVYSEFDHLKNTTVDSLSYVFGVKQAEGMGNYMVELGVDSLGIDPFINGVKDGANNTSINKLATGEKAYAKGKEIGKQLRNQTYVAVNREIFGENSSRKLSLSTILMGFEHGIYADDPETMSRAKKEFERLIARVKKQ